LAPPEVSILIPCYNGADCIGRCLRTVLESNGAPYEVIVVDNGSYDGSLAIVRSFSQVKVIANKINVGFPLAINQAADAAQGRFLAILNQDTEVDPGWLSQLTASLEKDQKVAVCGPKIVNATDRRTIQQMGVLVDRFGFGMYISDDDGGAHDVFMVSGAAMVVRREVFDRLGQFDPDFFMFEDDLDFCWRARLAGYRVVVNPEAVVYHQGGASMIGGFPATARSITSPLRRYYSERNTLQTLLKNYETGSIMKLMPLYLGMNLAEIGFYLVLRRSEGVKAYIRSLLYNVVHFKSTWKKHSEIARIRRLPDSAITPIQDPNNLRIVAFLKWGAPVFASRDKPPSYPGGISG
jgi:GT2 family glycosyltransferase